MLTLPSDSDIADPTAFAAVASLRSARNRRRLAGKEWGELAYRVYTTSLAALVAVVFLSGLVGDNRLQPDEVDSAVRLGPAWMGLLVALVVLIGVRSGSRGGPIAMERPDVQHLLLAPVDRGQVLRRPSLSVLFSGIGIAALVGALAGSLLDQRFPGPAVPWVASGALFAATTVALSLGAALLTASRRIPPIAWVLAAWLLVAWSAAAIFTDIPASPTSALGSMLFWPQAFTPLALAAVVIAVVLVLAGLALIGGLVIELALRRTALVGQLRFAVTQQDLRAVVLLRRQLAAERPRGRPWLPRLPRPIADRAPVLARDLASVGRWPARRVLRILVTGIAAALAARGVWSGTTPLLLVAGLAGYVAGLDALEPLAQEIDHPGLAGSFPEVRGATAVRHLAEPIIVVFVVAAVGVAVAVGIDPSALGLRVAAVAAVPAVLCAVAGAGITVVSDQVLDRADASLMQPEVAGPRLLIRTLWPPIVSVLGFVPLLIGRSAALAGRDPVGAMAAASLPVVILFGLIVVWVRFRDDIHESMAEATGRSAT